MDPMELEEKVYECAERIATKMLLAEKPIAPPLRKISLSRKRYNEQLTLTGKSIAWIELQMTFGSFKNWPITMPGMDPEELTAWVAAVTRTTIKRRLQEAGQQPNPPKS